MISQMTQEKVPQLLGRGQWNENVSWEFLLDEQLPDLTLCTAVCCFVVADEKLLLVKNKRGWEIPAGHVEPGEHLTDAVVREVFEEGNAEINSPVYFGYKKLTAKEKVLKPGSNTDHYPFPCSYVVFFYATLINFIEKDSSDDVLATKLVTTQQSLEILGTSRQYPGIIEYLTKIGILN